MEDKKKKYKGCKKYRWKSGEFWKPGDVLTEEDKRMLAFVEKYYKTYGYSPSQKEIPNAGALKKRFRIWNDVLTAVGIPSMNDPETVRKKQEARAWQERLRGGL